MLNRRRLQTGLSLVELMIGIAVGLFIVAAATLTTTSHLSENSQLRLETQVQQDLRAAADLITRDLRRAGGWEAAETGVWSKGNVDVVMNPNRDLTDAAGVLLEPGMPASQSIEFKYGATEAGFQLENGAIEILLGDGGYAQITDPATLTITTFDITLALETIDLSGNCLTACAGASCPTQHVRTLNIVLVGQAAHDARVTRQLVSSVRLPNDVVSGSCPA